jgi:hypothetical protein
MCDGYQTFYIPKFVEQTLQIDDASMHAIQTEVSAT